MKKIQIRSFVKGGNHGQYIQALGVAEIIKSINPAAEVSHLNYTNHLCKELKIQLISFHLPKYLSMLYHWYKRFNFTNFDYDNDVSVYGSDMIWHQISPLFPFDEVFFGKNDLAEKKISYAPSVATRGKVEEKCLSKYLSEYNAISVRDNGTRKFVIDHVKKKSTCVIDPCFFLLDSKYKQYIVASEKMQFVSVYSTSPKMLINKFLENKYNLQSLGWLNKFEYLGYFPRSGLFKELRKQLKDPLWTLKRIGESKLLITNTFHGVMMALMARTPFIAVTNPNLEARLDSPISECFGQFRLISDSELSSISVNKMMEYLNNDDIDAEKINGYISFSKQWLKDQLC